jgi:hypothetical protein
MGRINLFQNVVTPPIALGTPRRARNRKTLATALIPERRIIKRRLQHGYRQR